MKIPLTAERPTNQCCGTCCRVRMVGKGGLSSAAGICGALEDGGYGNLHVVLLDDPRQGSQCDDYKPGTISFKGTSNA